MRMQISNEWMAFNGQLGPGVLGPGPRTQGNRQRTMNETAKGTMNDGGGLSSILRGGRHPPDADLRKTLRFRTVARNRFFFVPRRPGGA